MHLPISVSFAHTPFCVCPRDAAFDFPFIVFHILVAVKVVRLHRLSMRKFLFNERRLGLGRERVTRRRRTFDEDEDKLVRVCMEHSIKSLKCKFPATIEKCTSKSAPTSRILLLGQFFYGMLTNSIKLIKNPRVSNWKRLRLITNLRAFELYFVHSIYVWVCVRGASPAYIYYGDVALSTYCYDGALTGKVCVYTDHGWINELKSFLNFLCFPINYRNPGKMSGNCLQVVLVRFE